MQVTSERRVWRTVAEYLGWTITIIAIGYLAHRLWATSPELVRAAADLSAYEIGIIGLMAVIYGGLLCARGWAWGILLGGFLSTRPAWPQVLTVHGRTQILKYLPGNIFHYAGRQVMGHRYGWSQIGVASASAAEGLLNIFAAVCLGAILLVIAFSDVVTPPERFVPILIIAIAAVAVLYVLTAAIAGWAAGKNRFPLVARISRFMTGPKPLAVILIHTIFFVGSGLLLAWVLNMLTDSTTTPVAAVCGAYAVAWTIGYLTPGAPGGLGVREATLVLLLGPFSGEPVALAAALIYRVTGTVGEFLYFLIAYMLGRPPIQHG